ncbi:MAG: heme o synthase [Labrys sp. (in: a-proteobacteria)]
MVIVSDVSIDLDSGHTVATDGGASAADYIALLKPRVMSLVVLTALTGIVLAPGAVNPVIALASIIAIAVGAGASGALNMWYDADIDAVMGRTAQRPIPSGRISRQEALAFGLILSCGSVLVLGLVANWLTAGLLAFTIFFYVVVYTMWLKRWTSQNIVIGGAAGALPPVVGWAAATGSVSIESLVLFAIIFMWTPPHFWALAIFKTKDYARAGVPMLPVVAGEAATRRQILVYTLLLAPLGVVPSLMGFAHWPYAIVAVGGGLALVYAAIMIVTRPTEPGPPRRMFGWSILYLFALFAVLLGEGLIMGA